MRSLNSLAADVLDQHDELVPAHAGDEVGRAHLVEQPPGNGL